MASIPVTKCLQGSIDSGLEPHAAMVQHASCCSKVPSRAATHLIAYQALAQDINIANDASYRDQQEEDGETP